MGFASEMGGAFLRPSVEQLAEIVRGVVVRRLNDLGAQPPAEVKKKIEADLADVMLAYGQGSSVTSERIPSGSRLVQEQQLAKEWSKVEREKNALALHRDTLDAEGRKIQSRENGLLLWGLALLSVGVVVGAGSLAAALTLRK